MKNKKKKAIRLILYIFVFLVFATMLFTISTPKQKIKTPKTYNQFLEEVEKNQVAKVYIDFSDSIFDYVDINGSWFTTDNPKIQNFKEVLLKKDIKVKEITAGFFGDIIILLVNFVLLYVLFAVLVKKMVPKTKSSKAITTVPDITFDNIAGHKELKRDLEFVVGYLKNPKKYIEVGARMPKGIILDGPPGTGKTLTAKAIAGTAGVPFFSVSGSDFIELYVGLGAKRVRDLYKQAKKSAPCIIFIDEIDAVGGDRNSSSSHDESRQTINALLGELDGFNGEEGILTICATNNVDVLDKALIRPGRFDKHFTVPLPEKEDRLELLKIHSKGKPFCPDINWEEIANMTINFSGAGIESVLNEAAFLAVNQNKKQISSDDIDRAFYKMVMKGDIKENQSSRDKEELQIVAWHEAGHAVVTKLLTDDEVPKVTILSSTSGAGGVTFRTPKEQSLYSKKYLKSLIKIAYAGRVAERLLLESDEKITTGASDDIKKATSLIKEYVSLYGMDEEIGLLNLSMFKTLGEETLLRQASILSKKLYAETEELLTKNYDKIKKIAIKLLEQETITEMQLNELLELGDVCDSKRISNCETEARLN